jgi:ankyrin repeat protein
MMACEFGCITAAKTLLRCGVEIDAVDKWGHSALHYAGGGGHGDCIGEALVAGANWKIGKSEAVNHATQ